ncbi:MAG: hypothetical protein ACI4PT_03345 [Candidatus Avoscillospira sp.]
MRDFFRKFFLPWTAADCFETEDQFQVWLRKRYKGFTDARAVFLVLAAVCLLTGYFSGRRPIMLLTVLPLALVLLLTMALSKTEALMDGYNNTETSEKE